MIVKEIWYLVVNWKILFYLINFCKILKCNIYEMWIYIDLKCFIGNWLEIFLLFKYIN